MTDRTLNPHAPADTPNTVSRLPYGVLSLLMIVYAFNMLDRQIVTILVEPMKRDLSLSDGQIGAISGLAFALFYTLLGIPLARIADRGNRVAMIAVSLTIWSAFTALCGLARNFGELLLARTGVGIGEAGCTPAAHSLITGFVPRGQRAWALSFYSLGTPVGSLAGLVLGGVLLATLGWRAAFLIAGLPGVVLAIIVWFSIPEPRRRDATAPRPEQLPLRAVIAALRRLPSFWLVSFGTAMGGFGYFGQAAFFGALYMRTHTAGLASLAATIGVAPSVALGLVLGLMVGVVGMAGTLVGGVLADRAGRRGIVGYTRVPSVALVVAAPLFAGAALAGTIGWSFVLLGLAIFVHALNYGSVFAAVQTLVHPSIRAMASAVQLFIINAIGLALGPLFVGVASDLIAPILGAEMGLRVAMALVVVPLALGSALFWLAGRRIARDERRANDPTA